MTDLKTWALDGVFEVNFQKKVCFDSIDELIRVLREAVNYQHYECVQINLQSPGGDFRALKHYMWHLNSLNADGIVLKTVGLVQVASAAAMMLSLGGLGHRQAYPHTELVYHFARISELHNVTAQQAGYLIKTLNEVDDSMLDRLISHIEPQILGCSFPKNEVSIGRRRFKPKVIKTVDDLKNKVRADLDRLFQLDQPITAEQALNFYLIDEILTNEKGA